jgi:hypothetical protein
MTHMNKERRLLKTILAPTPDCATPAQLERLAEPNARLWAHVASCPRCQAERALLAEFEAAAPLPHEERQVGWISQRLERRFAPDEQVTPGGGLMEPWWRRWFTFHSLNTAGLALATAVVAIALGVGLRQGQRPALVEPGRADATALRSGALDTVSPMGDLDAPPVALRWQPLPGATSYSVRLMEVDRARVWDAETSTTSAVLPPQVVAKVVPGKSLLWQVIAKDASGSTVGQSAVQRFRVRLDRLPQ